MSAIKTVQELNRELAARINAEARSNPQSPYANKFVGIANGQGVVVGTDLDDLVQQLRQMEADDVVRRTGYQQVPPKVEYCLAKWGQALCPALDGFLKWAELRERMSEKTERSSRDLKEAGTRS